MFTDVLYEDIKDRSDIVFIDTRSEGEFDESTIPGAIHVPIFHDDERAHIGTVYKQEGSEVARDLGLSIISPKLPDIVKRIQEVSSKKMPVIFCWRGGMRSKSVATVLDLMGVPCLRLIAGYRGYRQYVTERLKTMAVQDIPPLAVIHGMTGVGKTTLLHILQGRGQAVFDLEQWAGHRGSVFGGIGLKVANQRQFESCVLLHVDRYRNYPYVFIEAESRRIGHSMMPDFLFDAKMQGFNIELTASVQTRVKRTLEQYWLQDEQVFHEAVTRAVHLIEKRFSPGLRSNVFELLSKRQYEDLIALLLEEYYDPRYRHAMAAYERTFTVVDGEELTHAAQEIQELVCGHTR